MMKPERNGIIIGRFQPVHKGHESLIEEQRKDYNKLLIGIGDPKEYDPENPLSYNEREKIIESGYDHEFPIYKINDQGDPDLWIKEIEEKMEIGPKNKDSFIVITGNNYTALCFDKKGYDVKRLPERELKGSESYKGEVVREMALLELDWQNLVPKFTWKTLEELGINLKERIIEREIEELREKSYLDISDMDKPLNTISA